MYIKQGDILVSYRNLPRGLKRQGIFDVIPINDEKEFEELKKQIPYVHFDNYYMPRVYLQITGRCNFNCKHCFAAEDNNPLVTEWDYEEILKLLDQCRDCGVCGFTITGGEPTVHPHFMDIIDAIYERGMALLDLNTNGYLLTQEMLDHLKELGADPNIKISLDGLGAHDFMRGVPGAEEKALEAMKMCIKAGFRTYSQTQINRKTIDTIPHTLDVFDDMGLYSARLIKTTATPRWEKNAKDADYTFEEYYRKMIEISLEYIKKPHNMMLDIWEFFDVEPMGMELFSPAWSLVKNSKCSDNDPICKAFSKMISIGSDGEIYPCLEMQGVVNSLGYKYGSLKEKTLREILNEGPYRDVQLYTSGQRRDHNKECVECKYKDVCTGGCPGLSLIYSHGDIIGVDKSRCDFFKTGVYEEFEKVRKEVNSKPYERRK